MADVLDRKIRAILDAIETRNQKIQGLDCVTEEVVGERKRVDLQAAMKMINGALTKYPGNISLRSLKAHAWERAGNLVKALEMCDELMQDSPTDEEVQRIMLNVYRSTGNVASATELFRRAVVAVPDSENFLLSLFVAQIRQYDFAGQQQTAMKLMRGQGSLASASASGTSEKREYAWYLITVIFLQATMGPAPGQEGGMKREQLLKLAESMACKQLGPSPQPAHLDHLLLYLLLLLEQGKVKEALDRVGSAVEGGDPTLVSLLLPVQACLLARRGRLREAAELASSALREQGYPWGLLQFLLDCYLPSTAPGINQGSASPLGIPEMDSPFHLASSLQEREEDREVAQDYLGSAQALVDNLLDGVEGGTGYEPCKPRYRGRLLAAVDLEWRKLQLQYSGGTAQQSRGPPHENGVGPSGRSADGGPLPNEDIDLDDGATQPLAAAVLRYFKHMGHMPCCALDVRPYTARIRGSARRWLAEQVQCDASGGSSLIAGEGLELPAPSPHDVRRKVTAYQIENDLGLPEFRTAEEAQVHALQVMEVYRQSLPLISGLDEKERGLADELLPLCAWALVTGSCLSGSPLPLLQAVLALEAAQVRRQVSAPLRLSLMALYGLLGCPRLLLQQAHSLDIKHILLDTVAGHLVLPYMLPGGAPEEVGPLLQEVEALFQDHRWQCATSIQQAFSSANYTKAVEITKFSKRLERSYVKGAGKAAVLLHRLREAAAQGLPFAQASLFSSARHREQAIAGYKQPTETAREVVREVEAAEPNPLSELDREGLSFNADLQTRSPWLPPEAGPPGLAASAWWHLLQPPPGAGRCWWMQAEAVQLPIPEATAYRGTCLRHLECTWLQIYILSHVLSGSPAPDLPEKVERLRSTSDRPNGKAFADMLQEEPFHKAVSMLGNSILETAVVFQGMAGSDAAGSGPQVQVERLTMGLKALEPRLRDAMLMESKVVEGLLLGGAWQAAVYFVAQPCAWLSLLLQIWFQAVKPARKAKPKKAVAAEAQQEQPSAQQDLRTALVGLKSGCSAFFNAVESVLPTEDLLVNTAGEPLHAWLSSGQNNSGLWSWEDRFDASAVTAQAVQAQAEVIQRMRADLAMWDKCIATLPT